MTRLTPPHSLKARLLAMMVLRVVLAVAFLGITTWFHLRGGPQPGLNFYPFYALIIAIGLLTIFYALALNRVGNVALFTYFQVTADIALITVFVYVTGGTESYLHTLYPLSIIGGSILLDRRGGFFAASLSSIAYGVLIDMDFYGVLPARFKMLAAHATPAWEEVLTTVSVNIIAFFTIAYFSGYLAERTARAEKELKEKGIDFERLETLNRHIVENITSGIMTLDERFRITSFNRGAESVSGYTLREVYYRGIEEIFPGMIEGVDASFDGSARFEKRFRKKDDTEIHLGFTISRGEGGDVSMIVIFQDLTQLKDMEERLRRDDRLKALGELSVGIAHEIRNPLASISGSIQMLREEMNLSGENVRLMDIVLRETARLNALITDYLLFARPAREERRTVDLSSIVEETVKVFRNCPDAARVVISSDVRPGLLVEGDERQLGQVFWNLFLNAAHAMQGGGALGITSRISHGDGVIRRADAGRGGAADGGGPRVEIDVADSGHGIRREHIGRVFDPFFSTRDAGTGLGLAIVHRIVESHGGSIEVRSDRGRGTLFRLSFPLVGIRALN
jgi:two-component system sensor histidine kinase PilS (NtrC family)